MTTRSRGTPHRGRSGEPSSATGQPLPGDAGAIRGAVMAACCQRREESGKKREEIDWAGVWVPLTHGCHVTETAFQNSRGVMNGFNS
jgi:hypothetical protein